MSKQKIVARYTMCGFMWYECSHCKKLVRKSKEIEKKCPFCKAKIVEIKE